MISKSGGIDSNNDVNKNNSKKKSGKKKKIAKVKKFLNGMSPTEVEALVCTYFCCRKVEPADIAEVLKEHHGIVMAKNKPYQIIRNAAQRGLLRFVPLAEFALGDRLRKRFKHLQEVVVVNTTLPDGVASRGAQLLMDIVKDSAELKGKDESVHIGFAGGFTMRGLTTYFSDLIIEEYDSDAIANCPIPKRDRKPMPKKIHLHAMVSGFDIHDPTTDPNAMFTRFLFDPTIPLQPTFTAFHTPSMVNPEEFRSFRTQHGIKEAYEQRDKIEIVATSLASWDDDHSKFATYMKRCPESAKKLESVGVVGDMMWLPVGQRPIELETKIRAMTLMELRDLHEMIVKRDGKVLLCCGPCHCKDRKTAVLERILEFKQHVVTHLVIDIGTAKELLDG